MLYLIWLNVSLQFSLTFNLCTSIKFLWRIFTISMNALDDFFSKIWRFDALFIWQLWLQPFCQDYILLTPLRLYVLILYVSGVINSLMSTPNARFLRNFFMAGLFLIFNILPEIWWEIIKEIFFSYFVLMADLGFQSTH